MTNYASLKPREDVFQPYGLLSQATMFWALPCLVPANRANQAFVSGMTQVLDNELYHDRLTRAWDSQLKKRVPSFAKAVISVFWKKYILYIFPFFIMAMGQLAISVTINFLTETLQKEEDSVWYGLGLAVVYSGLSLVTVCMVNQGFLRGQILAAMIRTAVFSVLYDKTLKIPARDLTSDKISGRVTNLVAAELDIVEFISASWYLIITPFFILISTPVIYWLIGPAGLVGVGVVLAIFPIKWYLTKFVERFRRHTSDLNEARLKAIQNLVEGIKSIKMYAWEQELLTEIDHMKRLEYREYSNMNVLRNMTTTFLISGGVVIMLITLVIYVSLGNEIRAGSAFGAIGILLAMNNWVNGYMSWGIDVCTWYRTLFANLTEFMTLQEQVEERTMLELGNPLDIRCEGVYATWTGSSSSSSVVTVELACRQPALDILPSQSVLQNVTCHVSKGELCMIVGVVGSGKSSLLSALIGDLKLTEGSISINPSVAYVEQEPWIVSGTIRDNIIMGKEFRSEVYDKVISMCGLGIDLSQMEKSDLTMIGDRGSTLSGGQKARISLARAVYHRKEVYLLDDPLSAVDAKVGAHIFNECILKGLKGITRVIVTNQHKYLPEADKVMIMREGRIILQGTYLQVQDSEELRSVLCASEIRQKKLIEKELKNLKRKESGLDIWTEMEYSQEIQEEQEIGSVPVDIYLQYLHLFFKSRWALFGLVFLVGLLQTVNLGASYWVSFWAAQSYEVQQESWLAWGLAGIIGLLIILSVVRNVFLLEGMSIANLRLHHLALSGVAHTDLSFFDSNPQGRIISRFTKDVAVMEDLLLRYFSEFIMLATLLFSYMLALVITIPMNAVLMVVVIASGLKIAQRFVPATRQFKRLELATKAEIVGLLTETISGISTIRSLGLIHKFKSTFEKAAIVNFHAWYCFFLNMRALQMFIDYMGILFISGNAVVSVLLKGNLPADVLAVGFSFTVLVVTYLGWFSDVYVNVGNYMISGHRLFQYAKLPPEKGIDSIQPLSVSIGQVEFQNVCLKYAPNLDFALRYLTFSVPGGSKVGIVGRTGAGKSSVLLALFRLKELSSGSILIDGQNIAEVSLVSLRSQISVIPQSPLLFYGDVRRNVDPVKKYTEEQINAVLVDLQMMGFAGTDAHQLSTGQKQLLCLARALLRDSQIMVCDEATGSIDPKTEEFLQVKMMERLRTKTVLIIAHRLKTILSCDQVLVLENGNCVETGSPEVLGNQAKSRFSEMLRVSGTTFEHY